MIDMGMRQHHTVDLGDWNRQGSILFCGVNPFTLKHPAIEENRSAIDAQYVAGARDFTGCSVEFNFQRFMPRLLRCVETGVSAVGRLGKPARVPILPGCVH